MDIETYQQVRPCRAERPGAGSIRHVESHLLQPNGAFTRHPDTFLCRRYKSFWKGQTKNSPVLDGRTVAEPEKMVQLADIWAIPITNYIDVTQWIHWKGAVIRYIEVHIE